jgi:Acetyltransferase (isoleucine patch superfamily)
VPIRRQGLVKSPVLIGPDVWLGVKASVLRGSVIEEGTVVGANAVVRGHLPAFVIAAGAPAVVVKDRKDVEAQAEQRRIDVEDMARKAREATERRMRGEG